MLKTSHTSYAPVEYIARAVSRSPKEMSRTRYFLTKYVRTSNGTWVPVPFDSYHMRTNVEIGIDMNAILDNIMSFVRLLLLKFQQPSPKVTQTSTLKTFLNNFICSLCKNIRIFSKRLCVTPFNEALLFASFFILFNLIHFLSTIEFSKGHIGKIFFTPFKSEKSKNLIILARGLLSYAFAARLIFKISKIN